MNRTSDRIVKITSYPTTYPPRIKIYLLFVVFVLCTSVGIELSGLSGPTEILKGWLFSFLLFTLMVNQFAEQLTGMVLNDPGCGQVFIIQRKVVAVGVAKKNEEQTQNSKNKI